eukprot:jgi/Psemu1/293120/fgenesh1_pg.1674_\
MISEIANSLFLTYLASEYVLSSSPSSPSIASPRSRALHRADTDGGWCGSDGGKNQHQHPHHSNNSTNWTVLGVLTALVGIANLLDHHYYLSLVWESAASLLPRIPSHYVVIPAKLGLAATSYVLALYVDVHRERVATTTNANANKIYGKSHTHRRTPKKIPFRSVFLPKVGWAFLRILPAYPFLAVLISFVFLFVVDLWEYVLHLPLEWLNRPIYYGTLYGPFAYTYVHVKQEVVRESEREAARRSSSSSLWGEATVTGGGGGAFRGGEGRAGAFV